MHPILKQMFNDMNEHFSGERQLNAPEEEEFTMEGRKQEIQEKINELQHDASLLDDLTSYLLEDGTFLVWLNFTILAKEHDLLNKLVEIWATREVDSDQH